MTTLRTLIPSDVSRQLVELAADAGVTVPELRSKQVRDDLVKSAGRRRVTGSNWSDAERGLDWETRRRTGVRESCKACGAPVLWVESVKNEKPMPVDPLPHPKGNLLLEKFGAGILAHVIPKSAPRPARAHRPHFATCPAAGQMRRRGRLKVVATRPSTTRGDGRHFPDSTVMCPIGDGYVAQQLVDAGIRRHLFCPPDFTPEEEALLASTLTTPQETP